MLGSDLLGSSQALKSVTSSYNDTIMAVMTGKQIHVQTSTDKIITFTIIHRNELPAGIMNSGFSVTKQCVFNTAMYEGLYYGVGGGLFVHTEQ